MVQTVAKSTDPRPYTVLRPICLGGERVEVGTVIVISPTLGSELVAANKVAPGGVVAAPAADDKPAKATKPRADKPAADAREAAPAA